MFVCLCNSVTDHDINNAVDSGVTSFARMQESLGVSTVCGACECEVKSLLDKKLQSALSARQSQPEMAREIAFV